MKIITHNGPFHADDVFACVIANMQCWDNDIVRTRDSNEFESADYVIDVGGVHSPVNGRYDHHQQGGAGSRANGTPYAAAGLVWLNCGQKYVAECFNMPPGVVVADVAKCVDERLIQTIDAADCGVEGSDTSLSAAIAGFNPVWLGEDGGEPDSQFKHAMEIAQPILDNAVLSAVAEQAAVVEVKRAIDCMSHGVLQLEQFMPWQKTVVEHNAAYDAMADFIKFVVFPQGDTWMVQAVPRELGSFETLISHPENLWGLRDEELSEACGINDTVFVHPNGFIGGGKTKSAAFTMAIHAIEEAPSVGKLFLDALDKIEDNLREKESARDMLKKARDERDNILS